MSKIYCSNCGQLIPKNSNFCRYCGAPQHGPEASAYQAEAPPVNNAAAAFVLAQSQQSDKTKKPTAHKHALIKNRRLAKEAQIAFFLAYIGKTLPILILLIVGAFFEPLIFSVVITGYVLILLLAAMIVHSSFRFSIDELGFAKEYGIIHKQSVTIPYRQIENVNIVRNFGDMLLGLARINIETAGSSSVKPRNIIGGSITKAEGHLPGVTLQEARKIHDLLIEGMSAHKE